MRRGPLDVIVAGGGVAGAAAALALAREGFDVAVIEPRPAAAWRPDTELDLRVFALAPSSARLLDQLGVWRTIEATRASAYHGMQVVDAANGACLTFHAAEQGRAELGWIVENALLQHVLTAALAAAGVRQVTGHAQGIEQGNDRITLTLADGEVVSARLAIAAEGGNSALRQAAGIDTDSHDYGQRGIVAHVRPERPHGGIAWQAFLPTGPLALLPLADGRVSIVWTLPEADARQRLELDDAAFLRALGVASDFHLGRLTATTPRAAFPLKLQLAHRYRAGRLLLVGDAAHVVHPLAGQGINLGLRDVAELRNVLR
ncbi:MAG TPA: FAD-dependent oxidoreductase, partial [Rhodanobacteraceae bacterium]|nr:FAD-dependent oxidoreductase [Rhodanobacteraceae bacterium]